MKNSRKIVGLIGIILISLNLLGELTKEKKLELNKVLKDISLSLDTMHYKHMDIDNEFSKKVLENYLKRLDYNHQYFLQKEVDSIYKKWGTKLDEDFLEGNSDAAFDIYEKYEKSVIKSIKYQQKLLKKPKKLDFSKNEKLIVDREEESYFKTRKEYKEHWKKVLKSSILSLEEYEKLSYEQSVKRMKKRLDTRLELLSKKTSDDIYSYFVNSFLMEYDPHTRYLSEKEVTKFNISMKLQLSGIGAVLSREKGYI